MRNMNKKGQAIAELAIFGSIILLVFGVLLSFLQQMNNQQYVQMETFRRALKKACTYQGQQDEGAGASVQYTSIENRRNINLAGGFRQGTPSTASGSSNVFWAVPKVAKGVQADSLLVFKINEDEKTINYKDYAAGSRYDEEGKERPVYTAMQTGNLNFDTETAFSETNIRQENTDSITNTRSSTLKETITTTIPYEIKQKYAGDKDREDTVSGGELWRVTQGLYRDSDGQYKYSQDKVGTEVERSKTWQTEFAE
jgi:hypothetical protein